ncbi:hypothetical protein, partial [Sinorhizobium fredii]|uniref:hypothetical protein n=1 Tax=Rhizobium fredii TaxID=380 RepID=UPI001AEC42DC
SRCSGPTNYFPASFAGQGDSPAAPLDLQGKMRTRSDCYDFRLGRNDFSQSTFVTSAKRSVREYVRRSKMMRCKKTPGFYRLANFVRGVVRLGE